MLSHSKRRFRGFAVLPSPVAVVLCLLVLATPAVAVARRSVRRQSLASRIVWAGEHVGGREGTIGMCLKGVEDSLDAIGIDFPRLPYARQMGPVIAADKKQFREISSYAKLQPGDIIVHEGAPANPYGHIAIVLPGGLESSDHIQTLISPRDPAFGKSLIFQPIG